MELGENKDLEGEEEGWVEMEEQANVAVRWWFVS